MVKRYHRKVNDAAVGDDLESDEEPGTSRQLHGTKDGGVKKTKLATGTHTVRSAGDAEQIDKKPRRYIPVSTHYKRTKMITITTVSRSLEGDQDKIETETVRESASRIYHH
uniref:Uncharacterized protein n=1 Tax=Anopheles coluzzii TaxID=1518534 RepID=A0A8W7PYG1_ANOCL